MSALNNAKATVPQDLDPQLKGALIGAAAAVGVGALGYGLASLYSYLSPRNQHYKLIYFNLRGLAETSRLLFAIAGVSYTDFRYEHEQTNFSTATVKEFSSTRESLPFTRVPVLEVNGLTISQSKAIERYLAKQFGLFGSSNLESQLIDAVGEELRDCAELYRNARTHANAAEEKKKFFQELLPLRLRYLNRYALAHSTSSDHSTFVGSSLSLADVQLFNFASFFDDQQSIATAFAPYASLRAIRDAVSNHPAVRAWLAARPQTVM